MDLQTIMNFASLVGGGGVVSIIVWAVRKEADINTLKQARIDDAEQMEKRFDGFDKRLDRIDQSVSGLTSYLLSRKYEKSDKEN